MDSPYIVLKLERNRLRKVYITDILYCKADGAYTLVKTTGQKQFLVCSILKDMEQQLAEHRFTRINRTYLVNLRYCEEITTGRQPLLTLSNDEQLRISSHLLAEVKDLF